MKKKRKTITNLRYKIERLKEDNKHLKELCDKYEEEHNTIFEEWKKDIKANKKAIEYIEKYESIKAYYEYTDEDGYDEYNYDDDFKKDILNILKGDNK